MDTLIFVFVDDWEGIYIDGKLHTEGHSIRDYEWYKLGQQFPDLDFEDIKSYEMDEETIEDLGCSFPKNFSDIPLNGLRER